MNSNGQWPTVRQELDQGAAQNGGGNGCNDECDSGSEEDDGEEADEDDEDEEDDDEDEEDN